MKQKGKHGRKLLSFLLTLMMVIGLVPGMSLTAYAGDGIKYLDANGAEQSITDYTVVDIYNTYWRDGWYVVNSDVEINDGDVKVGRNVNLVLCDGAKLSIHSSMRISSANFAIYAQSTGNNMGELEVTGEDEAIEAFRSNLTINGGNVNVSGRAGISAMDGVVTINGGTVTVTGTWMPGIFTIDENNIVINGGNVTATGDSGIQTEGAVIINGGVINTTGGDNSGIDSYGVTISDGTVTATGGWCGINAQNRDVLIKGGKVNAAGPYGGIGFATVKNAIAGVGWTNTEGTQGQANIAVNETGQNLSSYKRVQFPAVIEKTDQTVTAPTVQTDLVYNGYQRNLLQSPASVMAGNSDAQVMYQYAGDDSWYTFEDLPKKADAGTYTVNYKVDGNDSFNEFTGSIEVTISKAEATITARDQAIKEGEAVATGTDQVTVDGLQEGQMLNAVSVSAGTGDDADKVIASGATILDANGADVTANYNIKYVPGSLKVHKKISATVTFKVQNGSWDEGEGDEATADRTVILSGYEGDRLTLTEDQIPAVGNKPDDTYEAGSWDVTPGTDTVITEDTTYTYIYKQGDIDTYTLTIPSSLKVKNTGWNATDGISASGTLGSGKKLTVTAASANGWALKSDEASVGYTLTTEENGSQTETWEFTALDGAKQGLGIMVEDYSGKPAGEYKDTVTFTAKVERSAAS